MNKRIQELVKQAEEYAVDKANGDTEDDFYYSFDDDFQEKFAELIIRECTDIVTKRRDAAIEASWDVDEAMSNAVWDIESHFYGVE